MLGFFSVQLDQDDGLLGAQKVGQYADHFDIERLDLISRKNRVGDACHSRFYLVQRDRGWPFAGAAGSRNRDRAHDQSENHKEETRK